MADYAFPLTLGSGAGNPSEGSYWRLHANTQVFQSPLSGTIQTAELPGAYWACGLRIDMASVSEAAAIQAWLVKLRGQANRALIPNWERMIPRGTIAGTPRSHVQSQIGTVFVVGGCTVGTTLLAGDYIGVNQGTVNAQLLMVTDACSASGSGVMSLSIYPEIRTAPSSGQTVVTSGPTARFILATPVAQWQGRIVNQADFSIDFIESPYV